MTTITIEITGPVAIGGIRPGKRAEIAAFADGTPVDVFWRKRFADEALHGCGAVRIVSDPAPRTAEDAPVSPSPAPKKGR
ncbi:MAG: hypothetical protein NW216_07580 [Hyphomicrobium sp.]|nr:hypothetical protein [Hyphomicrobium sp.]